MKPAKVIVVTRLIPCRAADNIERGSKLSPYLLPLSRSQIVSFSPPRKVQFSNSGFLYHKYLILQIVKTLIIF